MKLSIKKLAACMLCVAMCFSVFAFAEEEAFPAVDTWDGTADYSWYTPEENVFTLTTAEQLAGLAGIVNGTVPSGVVPDSFYGKTVNLAADLVLNSGTFTYSDSTSAENAGAVSYNGEAIAYDEASKTWKTASGTEVYAWTPIGNLEGNNNIESVVLGVIYKPGVFLGSFNGQGHTVSGMYVCAGKQSTSDCYKGLFGTFAGPSLKNLTVTNSYVSGAGRCGSIAGMVYGLISKDEKEDDWEKYLEKKQCVILENLHSDGMVAAYHETAGNRMSGGLFGIVRLYDKGDDIKALNGKQVKETGGVICLNRCGFTGTVDCGTGQWAGGLVGWLAGFAMKPADEGKYDIVFRNCYAAAKLISAKYAGGMAAYGYRADFVMENCVTMCQVLTTDAGPQGAMLGISYYSNASNSDHMASLVIENSFYLPDIEHARFDAALGVLSGNQYPITNTNRTDLTGAVKINSVAEITGLDSEIWTIGENSLSLSSAYAADPDDPTSEPILPGSNPGGDDRPGGDDQPGGDDPGNQDQETDPSFETDHQNPFDSAQETEQETHAGTSGGEAAQNQSGCKSNAGLAIGVLAVLAVFGVCLFRKPEEI